MFTCIRLLTTYTVHNTESSVDSRTYTLYSCINFPMRSRSFMCGHMSFSASRSCSQLAAHSCHVHAHIVHLQTVPEGYLSQHASIPCRHLSTQNPAAARMSPTTFVRTTRGGHHSTHPRPRCRAGNRNKCSQAPFELRSLCRHPVLVVMTLPSLPKPHPLMTGSPMHPVVRLQSSRCLSTHTC